MSRQPEHRQQSMASSAGEEELLAQVEPFLPSTKDGVLHRNRACHQCRKKKLKCDAQHPHCSACIRARRSPHHPVECTWDEFKIPRRTLQAMRRAEKEKLRAQAQQGRNSEQKRKRVDEGDDRANHAEDGYKRAHFDSGAAHTSLQESSSRMPALPSTCSVAERQTRPDAPGAYPPQETLPPHLWQPSSHIPINPTAEWLSNRSADSFPESSQRHGMNDTCAPKSQIQKDIAFSYFHPAPIPGLDLNGHPEPEVDDEWMKVIWPGWSPFLPAPHVVEHFVNVFFSRVFPYSKMIHKASFYQRLGLPPTHPRFPPKVLLHAIIATASRYTSADALSGAGTHMFALPRERGTSSNASGGSTPSATTGSTAASSSPCATMPIIECPFYPHDWVSPLEHRDFANWHYSRAAEDVAINVAYGRHLVATVQAKVLLTQSHFFNAAWAQAWADSGATLRLCPPIGLHESPNIVPEDAFGAALLHPAQNVIEREERSRTFWMAFMLERTIGFSSTFSTSMGEDDITVELPIAQEMFEAATVRNKEGLEPSQSLHQGQFYLQHPPEHADSLNLLIKITRLAATAGNFRRQYARQPKTDSSYAEHPLVRLFLHQVTAFRLSFPPHLRKPARDNLQDPDLVAATSMCHLVTLILGEPYIDTDTWQSDLANRTLVALRSILSMIYDLISTSYDMSFLHSIFPFIWLTSARVTLRFAMAARCTGDLTAVDVFMAEADVYRLACQAFGERSCAGLRQAAMITDMIELSKNSTKDQFTRSTGKCIKPPESEMAESSHSARDERFGKALGVAPDVYQGTTIDLASFSFEAGDADMSFLGSAA